MDNFGLVSIITPSYNSSSFIAETIESILSQTYLNWELLITDDCSTDRSVEIIERYIQRDSRIKLFRLEKNCGAGVCRNRSISEAKGRFIAFCDSDDRWRPEKLEKQLAFMREKDCALSYTSYMTCDESGKISSIVIGKRRETYFSMRCDNRIGCLTAVYDTEKVGKVFMPELRKRQDWGLWLTILRRCEVAYGLKEPLAIYRIHSNSISRNKGALMKYNISVYKTVLGYSPMASYLYFFILFLPSYFSDKKKKENYLKSLFQGTYIRDIKERYNIRNDDDLNELIDIIASNIGCLTNPTNLENTFKSVKGHSISDTTIQSYLGMLQDAFMVEKAIRYDIKGKHYINTPSKYYFEDVGLRNARLNYRQIDGGHLMENIIYNELRIRGYSVDVGQVEVRTTNAEGKKIRKLLEVDFICNSGNKRMYIQSALDMPTPEKIDQETNSLRHINDGFPKIVIVGGLTPSYVNTDGISIMNVIDFLKDTEMGLL